MTEPGSEYSYDPTNQQPSSPEGSTPHQGGTEPVSPENLTPEMGQIPRPTTPEPDGTPVHVGAPLPLNKDGARVGAPQDIKDFVQPQEQGAEQKPEVGSEEALFAIVQKAAEVPKNAMFEDRMQAFREMAQAYLDSGRREKAAEILLQIAQMEVAHRQAESTNQLAWAYKRIHNLP